MSGGKTNSPLRFTTAFKRVCAGRNKRVVASQNFRRMSQTLPNGNINGNQPERIVETPPDSLEEEPVLSGGIQEDLFRAAAARRQPLSQNMRHHFSQISQDHPRNNDPGETRNGGGLPKSALHRLKDDPWRKMAKELTKENLVLVESLKRFQDTTTSKPQCCQLKNVKKVMMDVATKILLGNFAFSTIYPTEDVLMESILAAFHVSGDDYSTRELFFKEWGPFGDDESSLRAFANRNIRERRGSLTRDLRNELFKILGLVKPEHDATPEELMSHATKLQSLCEGDHWRTYVNSNGILDPFGSQAFYGSIAKVMQGSKYDRKGTVAVTLEQCGFFYHVMKLAMHGKNLTEGHASMHMRAMKDCEEEIKRSLNLMSRVIVIEVDDCDSEV